MPYKLPIIDMHCDLLSYLTEVEEASYDNMEDIGCALPYLQLGKVRLQILAIYSPTDRGSTNYAMAQIPAYESLLKLGDFVPVTDVLSLHHAIEHEKVGTVIAFENGSGLAEEDEHLDKCFERLDYALDHLGRIIYISLTHHYENRFGGGNYADAGLKDDGKKLLEYMNEKGIAVDLSHTSDALAHDILDYTIKKNLDNVPVIASHSNFRAKWDHVRNLSDEFAQEIIKRQGLIGINFLREYVDRNNPATLLEHIIYGFENGGEDALCFGADYFYVHSIKDPKRIPLFFRHHENATSYHPLMQELKRDKGLSVEQLAALSSKNVINFLERTWK